MRRAGTVEWNAREKNMARERGAPHFLLEGREGREGQEEEGTEQEIQANVRRQ